MKYESFYRAMNYLIIFQKQYCNDNSLLDCNEIVDNNINLIISKKNISFIELFCIDIDKKILFLKLGQVNNNKLLNENETNELAKLIIKRTQLINLLEEYKISNDEKLVNMLPKLNENDTNDNIIEEFGNTNNNYTLVIVLFFILICYLFYKFIL